MAQVASPYGLRIVKLLGDLPQSGGMHSIVLSAAPAFNVFFGDPVAIVGGLLVVATQPAQAVGGVPTAANPIGVFQGCSWQDPIRGFVNSQYLPANLTGVTRLTVKIADYPWLVMKVQASGSVTGPPAAVSKVGLSAKLIAGAGGSTATGDSSWQLDVTTVGANAGGSVLIYDYVIDAAPAPGAGSMPGDPYTDLLVIWQLGVHRWTIGGGA